MTKSLGSADFFALEAGEYLERLATILGSEEGPRVEEFVRFSRALRGSALMANQTEFAHAAGGLEALARAYRDGAVAWIGATQEGAVQAVEDMKSLLRRAASWTASDTERAGHIAKNLQRLAGQPSPDAARREAEKSTDGLKTGVRAFVAREGALIASALDRAARALAIDPSDFDPVQNVVRRMQSLRGLAELTDLPPLPEILDSLEAAAGHMARGTAPPPSVAEMFRTAARAMTRASRDVADTAQLDPDAPESREFALLLVGAFALEADVVDISALAPVEEVSVAQLGESPTSGPMAGVELVSQGEYLVGVSRELEAARSDAERDLRLFGLLESLRAVEHRVGLALAPAFTALIRTTLDQFGVGSPAPDPAFVSSVVKAGELLRQTSDDYEPGALGAEMLAVLTSAAAPAPAPVTTAAMSTPSTAEDSVVPIEVLAPEKAAPPEVPGVVVSIVDLAPGEPAPIQAAEAHPVEELGGLAGGLASYQRLIREKEPEPVTLHVFLAPSGAAPAAKRPATQELESAAVEIDSLLYRGEAAIERAQAVGDELTRHLSAEGGLRGAEPLLEELLALLPLAHR